LTLYGNFPDVQLAFTSVTENTTEQQLGSVGWRRTKLNGHNASFHLYAHTNELETIKILIAEGVVFNLTAKLSSNGNSESAFAILLQELHFQRNFNDQQTTFARGVVKKKSAGSLGKSEHDFLTNN